jgi:methylmalonyl-CoA/ethylmalonyl-CoA epimerase
MSTIRRLDHVAFVVRDTEAALRTFADRLGLPVAHSEVQEHAGVRLTYLDCGNAFLQLVEPTDPDHDIARWLEEHGEGIHHICFGVEDALAAAAELAPEGAPAPVERSGRGHVSAFVPGDPPHGVRIECTELDPEPVR